MGVFLAQPITSALNEALATSAALSEVRRILELIVPLAYRPPIKVDFNHCDAAAALSLLRIASALSLGSLWNYGCQPLT